MSRRKNRDERMSFHDAMDLAESMDLPDGAFWAMSHELAGLEYGDGFDQLVSGSEPNNDLVEKTHKQEFKKLKKAGHSVRQLSNHHFRINEKCDWWPTARKFRLLRAVGKATKYSDFRDVVKAIEAKS